MASFKAHRSQEHVSDEAVDSFWRDGYVVIEGMLNPGEIQCARTAVKNLAEDEVRRGTAHIYGPHMQRVWNLLDKHEQFQNLMTSPHLLAWMERLFDRPTTHQKFFLSSIQANVIGPGAPPLKLHIDTPVPEPLPPWMIKSNTIWLLDDFTASNGSTEVIAGSHKRDRKPDPERVEDEAGLEKVIAPAGSMVIIHGAIWHRSGANLENKERIVLLGSFAASYAREIASEEDIVRCVRPDVLATMSEKCKAIIGFHHGMKPGGRR